MAAHPVGLQVQHLLLEQVFHLSARTVKFLVEPRRAEPSAIRLAFEALGRQVGHDKTGIVSGGHHFGLADHSTRATPTPYGPIFELRKRPRLGGATQTSPR